MWITKLLTLPLLVAGVYCGLFAVRDHQAAITINKSKKAMQDFEFELAQQLANQATALSPLDAETHLNQAYVYGTLWAFRREDPLKKQMDAALARVEQLNPKSAYFAYRSGVFYADAGEYSGALKHLDRALKLDPYAGPYWYEKGIYLQGEGQYRAALNAYEYAYTLQQNPYIAQAIKMVRSKL